MSLLPSQNAISQEFPGIEAYPNDRANGSTALRTRSPHSERLKQLGERLPDQAAYLDKQSYSQVAGRSSENSLSSLSETYVTQHNESGNVIGQHFQTSEGHHSFRKQSAWRMRLDVFWIRNKGVLMVLLAELFSAFMITATRLLETDNSVSGAGMEPFQVCLPRKMSIASADYNIQDSSCSNGHHSFVEYDIYVVDEDA